MSEPDLQAVCDLVATWQMEREEEARTVVCTTDTAALLRGRISLPDWIKIETNDALDSGQVYLIDEGAIRAAMNEAEQTFRHRLLRDGIISWKGPSDD